MAPFGVANRLALITPALAGRNILSYRQGEPRAARICGVPPAQFSLAPDRSLLVPSVLQ